MKVLILFALFCSLGAAQTPYQALPATTNYPALATTINGKPNMSSGSGAPTANCTAFLDIYTDSATNNVWGCPQTNTWALWVFGTTFTNSEHSLGGRQFFPDTHYSNVDVSTLQIDYSSPYYIASLATGWPTVSNATCTAGTVTLTLSSTAAITSATGYSISGISPSGYDATSSTPFPVVTVVDGTHATYPVVGGTCPGSYVSGGTVATTSGSRMGVDQGMAINVATNATPTPPVALVGANITAEFWVNDIGAFPVTPTMYVEGGGTVASPGSCGDCHLLVLNTDTGILYEASGISSTTPPYVMANVAIWNLKSNNLRTNLIPSFTGATTDNTGITSVDQAGFPIAPLTLTHAELYAGCPGGVGTCTPVKHALRITFPHSNGFIWPATHGGISGSSTALPEGIRLILPLSYSDTCNNFDNIGQTFASYPPVESLKWTLEHYGAMFADQGTATQITLDNDPGWGTDQPILETWTHCILGQDFAVVREYPSQGINIAAIGASPFGVSPLPAATPTFAPAAGSYYGTQSVTLASTTASPTIWWNNSGTFSGCTPSACSGATQYTGALSISSTQTVYAIATATGYGQSAAGSALYTISTTAATPTFSPGSGTYGPAQTVTISSATPGTTIWWNNSGTFSGCTPSACSGATLYAGPISVSTTQTVYAIATETPYTNSPVGSAAYVINGNAATPTFSPAAGSYSTTQSVTISSSTAGSTLWYNNSGTFTGCTPSACSGATQYTTAISISTSQTIYAIATKTLYGNSSVGSAAYSFPIALVSHGLHGSTGSMLTSSWPSPISTTGANFIVVVETLYQHATVAPTDTFSNTWAQCGTDIETTTGAQIYTGIWYAANATVGASHSFGLSAGTSYSSMYVAAFSNLSNSPCTAAISSYAAGSSGATVQPGSITPAANGSLIISSPSGFYTSASWTATVNSSFTATDTGSTPAVGTGGGIGYLIQATAGAVNPTWTQSVGAALAAAIQVAFK